MISTVLPMTARKPLSLLLFLLLPALASPAVIDDNPLIGKDVIAIAASYGPQSEFTIKRNGKVIGSHQLMFDDTDDKLQVAVDSKIKVRILGIPVYSLSYGSVEQWNDGHLESVSAETIENGKQNVVEFSRSESAPKAEFASNHWHPGVLLSRRVFNTLTGDIEDVDIVRVGEETIKVPGGQSYLCIHYRYLYDTPVDSWYDNSGRWIKLSFSAEDGSVIEYLRND